MCWFGVCWDTTLMCRGRDVHGWVRQLDVSPSTRHCVGGSLRLSGSSSGSNGGVRVYRSAMRTLAPRMKRCFVLSRDVLWNKNEIIKVAKAARADNFLQSGCTLQNLGALLPIIMPSFKMKPFNSQFRNFTTFQSWLHDDWKVTFSEFGFVTSDPGMS
jgi:hypothetical protein